MKNLYSRILLTAVGLFLTIAGTTAQTPVIDSNYKYARGATMAFVRMTFKSNGATISERGVCCSETTEPTVNDIKANGDTQLSNKGPIYWLKDLKPATKYYMRGFVITSDGQTIYGEPMKFYTIPKGQIRLEMREGGDAATYNRIKTASETAVNWWNNLTEIKDFRISVGNDGNAQTADCSYGGWIRVGNNQSYQRTGTLLHEMLHGVGVIPWADTEWSRYNLRSGVNGDGYGTGQWLGDRVTEVLTFLENTETHLNGDYQHMWPYGINGAQEDNGSDLLYIGNSLVCQALGEDGLQHTSTCFAQPYYSLEQEDNTKFYIKNESVDRGRYSKFLTVNANGGLELKEMTSEQALADENAAWTTTFTPNNQFYQIRNVGTGRYITFNGSNFSTAELTKPTSKENLQLMKGRVNADGQRGYWLIQPTSDWVPKCINAYANGNIGAQTFNIANSAESQRWLIMDQETLKKMETTAVTSIKKTLSSLLLNVNALAKIAHQENVEGADAQFAAAINALQEVANSSTSVSELLPLEQQIINAGKDFLANVRATDSNKPFVLTFLMKNPDLSSNSDGWSQSATINHSCAEFYQTTFDFNQTVEELPAGTYKVSMQGFQRPGSAGTAMSDYASGTNNVNTYLYAGDQETKIAHIAKNARSTSIGGGSEQKINGQYIPDNMEAASLYFNKKLYENEVTTTIESSSDLKIGIKSSSMPSSYWVIFDNFRLYSMGVIPTAIRDVKSDAHEQHIFTLDGRRLSQKAQLKPGIYVINGKKAVIK